MALGGRTVSWAGGALLAVVWVLAVGAASAAPAAPPKEDVAKLGGLQLRLPLPAGWERAPAEAEKDNKAWMFGRDLPDGKGTWIVSVSFDNLPFTSAADRQARIGKYLGGFRNQPGFSSSLRQLAGKDAVALRFRGEQDDAPAILHHLLVADSKAVYFVYVFIPGQSVTIPQDVEDFLGRLSVVEGAPAVGASTTPATKPATPATPKEPPVTETPKPPAAGTGSVATTPPPPRPAVPSPQPPAPTPPALPGQDVPWTTPAAAAAVAVPTHVLPAKVDDALDFATLTQEQYTGAVSAAVEGLRVLQGPLPPEQSKAFEAKWAPYFDHPTEDIVAYLNRLNPLLAQFLAVRAALAAAALDFDAAQGEAALAAYYQNEGATRTALAAGYRHREMMLALRASLAGIAQQIADLGNPPDPLAAQETARRRHRAAAQQVRELFGGSPLDGEWEYSDGRRVVHQAVRQDEGGLLLVYSFNRTHFDKLYEEGEGDLTKPGTVRTKKGEMMAVPGLYDLLEVYEPRADGTLMSFSSDLTTVLRLVTVAGETLTFRGYQPADGFFVRSARMENGTARRLGDVGNNPPVPRGESWNAVLAQVTKSGASKVKQYQDLKKQRPEDVAALLRGSVSASQQDAAQQQRREARLAEIKAWVEQERKFDVASRVRMIVRADTSMDAPKTPAAIDAAVKARLPAAQAEHEAEIKRREAEMIAQMNAELGASAPVAAAPAPAKPDGAAAAAAQAAKEKAEQERARKALIEEREQSLTYLRQKITRARQDLADVKDESARRFYEWQIRGWEADMQGERDEIQALQTGERSHTRTAWDEQCLQRMVQQSVEYNRRADTVRKIAAGIERMAGTVAPEEAEELRAFARRQLDAKTMAAADVGQARKAASAVFNKVQGLLQADAAKQDERAAWAGLGLEAAENIKGAADVGMQVTSAFGGQGVMYAYQAATGYVQGGPVEAVKKAASVYSQAVDYAATAYDGYQEGGWDKAKRDVAWKFVQDKTLAYVVGKLQDGPKAPPPTIKEQFEAAKFRQEAEWGESMVKDFARRQATLEAAGHNRTTTPQELLRLQQEVRQAATAIAGTPAAKNFLKYKGNIRDRRVYDAHLRAVYAEVDAKVMEHMGATGYNSREWQLKEFRNADSIGSVNMDRDVGLDEANLTRLLKGGKPVSLHQWQMDAQDAYRKVYQQVTGRSADAAWQTVTTTAHPEAYKDAAWLGKDLGNINPAWAPQAADVTRFKAAHTMHDPANQGLPYFARLQEVSRGTAKDMNTKLLPLLRAKKPKTPEAEAKLQESVRHWQTVQTVLDAYGSGKIDPLAAQRRIYEITGGKSITQVVEDMATMMEGAAKIGR